MLVTLGLCACRSPDGSLQGRGADKRIDVASVVAGCQSLEDCNRRCTDKSPSSCVSAGRLYEFGHGVSADPSRAFVLYERACDANYAGGCYNAAVLLESGKGVAKDRVRARQLYTKVCGMGSKTSCERARALGDGGRPD